MASISFIMDVEGTFDMAKSRNYFKSKNVLVLKKSSENSDTLISEIFRNGKVKSIYLIKKGNKTKVKLDEIKFQDQEMKTDFISY
jgi:hypothetical protein